MDYQEYKKLRARGLRASTAKHYAGRETRDPLENISALPDSPLVLRRNGFIFIVKMEIDPDGHHLLDDLGVFSDDRGENAVAHEHHTDRTFNWFNPANLDTIEGLIASGMSKHDADCRVREEARENYRRVIAYGTDWSYYLLNVQAYLDQPEMSSYILAENWLGGVDIEHGKPEGYLSYLIDEQIHELLPSAFEKIIKLHKCLCGLTVTTKAAHTKRVEELAEELEAFAATFLLVAHGEDITKELINRWCEDTLDGDDEDYSDLLPKGVTLEDWVRDVQDHAADLADYYQSKHLSPCRHKCPM
ncbi:MAG TPA: hypothetical protein EYP35_02525 [Desulfobacterales bacterium]|nr:hypothetical protein [Desulfobacterales bacterium]